jgi:hypothetical protein
LRQCYIHCFWHSGCLLFFSSWFGLGQKPMLDKDWPSAQPS